MMIMRVLLVAAAVSNALGADWITGATIEIGRRDVIVLTLSEIVTASDCSTGTHDCQAGDLLDNFVVEDAAGNEIDATGAEIVQDSTGKPATSSNMIFLSMETSFTSSTAVGLVVSYDPQDVELENQNVPKRRRAEDMPVQYSVPVTYVNACTCDNGDAATGDACTSDNSAICATCTDAALYLVDGVCTAKTTTEVSVITTVGEAAYQACTMPGGEEAAIARCNEGVEDKADVRCIAADCETRSTRRMLAARYYIVFTISGPPAEMVELASNPSAYLKPFDGCDQACIGTAVIYFAGDVTNGSASASHGLLALAFAGAAIAASLIAV